MISRPNTALGGGDGDSLKVFLPLNKVVAAAVLTSPEPERNNKRRDERSRADTQRPLFPSPESGAVLLRLLLTWLGSSWRGHRERLLVG